jgi:hypothetical protein
MVKGRKAGLPTQVAVSINFMCPSWSRLTRAEFSSYATKVLRSLDRRFNDTNALVDAKLLLHHRQSRMVFQLRLTLAMTRRADIDASQGFCRAVVADMSGRRTLSAVRVQP